ncbi:VanZ family protein [Glycomyces tritici]|uniref:VanZ family protein n=1 Tax=Glycomyces tritici TaxID=2665176 RepID=A0ABT7YTM2_9ACTN|nr:VanZ family protein [Glycomyces tritici]MDN3241623.1 VanZ family protein [Glycomyces tritici]
MIAALIAEHPWLSPALLLVLIVLGFLVGPRLSARPTVAWALAGASVVAVMAAAVVPEDRVLQARCEIAWSLPTPERVEPFANLVLFIPIAFLIAVAGKRPLLGLLAGVTFSALIEAVQALLPAIGRSCDTGDWVANSIGAIGGAALAWAVIRLRPRGADDADRPSA